MKRPWCDYGRTQEEFLGVIIWARVNQHSLGWACVREGRDPVGFVNVAWDGGVHAFILGALVTARARRPGHSKGKAPRAETRLITVAAENARAAGCDWLHGEPERETRRLIAAAPGPRPHRHPRPGRLTPSHRRLRHDITGRGPLTCPAGGHSRIRLGSVRGLNASRRPRAVPLPRRSRSPLAGQADDVLVTDGQYVEAKKILIGLYLVEAAELDSAISWAAHLAGGAPGGRTLNQ